MTDKTISIPADLIPGMSIKFSGPINPEGKGIEFTLPVDALIPLGALNDRLDVVGAALRRQAAIEELPIVKQSLHANLLLLKKAQDERRKKRAALDVKVVAMSGKRRNVDDRSASPVDARALEQADNQIMQVMGQIEGARARIPYLEAIIRGEEPPELYADDERLSDAAE